MMTVPRTALEFGASLRHSVDFLKNFCCSRGGHFHQPRLFHPAKDHPFYSFLVQYLLSTGNAGISSHCKLHRRGFKSTLYHRLIAGIEQITSLCGSVSLFCQMEVKSRVILRIKWKNKEKLWNPFINLKVLCKRKRLFLHAVKNFI